MTLGYSHVKTVRIDTEHVTIHVENTSENGPSGMLRKLLRELRKKSGFIFLSLSRNARIETLSMRKRTLSIGINITTKEDVC